MTRTVRFWVFAVSAGGVAILVVLAVLHMPAFGGSEHPYRTAAISAAVSHATSNAVSSVNFDLRGLDTLGEETIFLTSVLVIVLLLRAAEDEMEVRAREKGRPLDSTIAGGLVFVPIILVIGLDVITHGHLTPGGGFQGGVVLGSGVHLVYLAGTYRMLERVRPVRPFEWSEAMGAAAFACLGICGMLLGVSFLANVVSTGTLGTLFSAGTVPILNGIVGIEVASGVVVLLSKFFEQAITVRPADGSAAGKTNGQSS